MTLFNRIKEILNLKGMTIDSVQPVRINATQNDKQKKIAQLTPRELELFLLLVEGYTLKECAKQLSIKYSTANTHMTSVYKKLEVNTRPELIINYRGIDDVET